MWEQKSSKAAKLGCHLGEGTHIGVKKPQFCHVSALWLCTNGFNWSSLFFLYNGRNTFLTKLRWKQGTWCGQRVLHRINVSVSPHSPKAIMIPFSVSLILPFSTPSCMFKVSFILGPLWNIFDSHSKDPKVSSINPFIQQTYIEHLIYFRHYYGTGNISMNKKRLNLYCHRAYMVTKCMVMRMHWLLSV